jgi:hypothetical protein
MRDLESITCCFIDSPDGLYLPLARSLAPGYKRLLYTNLNAEGAETINEAVIGEAFPAEENFERIDDFWMHRNEVDLWVLPDSKAAGLQLELERQGFPVWGSRRSIYLEHSRETFIRVLKDLGLEVPKYKRIIGLDALRDYLRDKEDQIIKISRYRRSMETRKWRSWADDEWWLDLMAVNLGGVKNIWPFLVFESIETDLELGADTYFVNGQFPKVMVDGYERKSRGYFAAVKPAGEMPEQTRAVMDAFAPILEKAGHGNFWTIEVRVKDEHSYFIDPTPRGPMPASGSQALLYKNLPEIIAAGAEGELVEPDLAGKFAAEVGLTLKREGAAWRTCGLPAELADFMKLSGACYVNGRAWFPYRQEDTDDGIGWLCAIGDTPQETIEKLLAYKELLPPGVEADTDSMVDLLKEIKTAEQEGIEFSKQPVPEPETVVQDA